MSKRPQNKKQTYLKARVAELKAMTQDGTPWVFLCGASLIDYLAKLVGLPGREGYKDFIKKYMANVDPRYATFQYKNKKEKLPDQMYSILRCGLFPDDIAKKKINKKSLAVRKRSIALFHKFREPSRVHLNSYSSGKIKDAATFLAEDFIEDLDKTVDHIFAEAKKDKTLKAHINKWWTDYPPIMDEPDIRKK
jgi:hypothetical protein